VPDTEPGERPSGLARCGEAAKDGELKFTALLHHVSHRPAPESYYGLKKQAAPGVDGVTWQEYGQGLEARYRPARGGTVLNQIWEEDFLGFSTSGTDPQPGFRPERGQPGSPLVSGGIGRAVGGDRAQESELDSRLGYACVRSVFDLFFDKLQHEWLVKFVEHRIGDKRVVRLIQKWLKAGVMEDGQWSETKEGSPQGSVIPGLRVRSGSPILANLYLHYVLDLWVEVWRKKLARGEVMIVRYADDAVLGFEHREDAERFLEQLRERLRKFGLELHPEKTRLIEFGALRH